MPSRTEAGGALATLKKLRPAPCGCYLKLKHSANQRAIGGKYCAGVGQVVSTCGRLAGAIRPAGGSPYAPSDAWGPADVEGENRVATSATRTQTRSPENSRYPGIRSTLLFR